MKYDEPGQKEWLTVEKSEPELIAGSPNVYKRHFKVTFPKMDTKGIRNAMLLVHNGGSEVECDTIFVRHTIYYPGTDLEGIPVEKNGVTTIWAPVNCGATRLPTEIYLNNGSLTPEQLQSNFEQQGYLYQWGRKVPFKPMNKDQACDFVEFATDNDFPTYEEGTVPGYAGDKFIIGTPTNAFNWFKNSNPSKPDFLPTIQAAGNTWPRQNDPCTNGWRIASKDEWKVIVDTMQPDKAGTNKRIWVASQIPGFVVPDFGSINSLDGEFTPGSESRVITDYFVSTYRNTFATLVSFYSGGININNTGAHYLGFAQPIRCVQE